jgi:hypothetical protein
MSLISKVVCFEDPSFAQQIISLAGILGSGAFTMLVICAPESCDDALGVGAGLACCPWELESL